MAAAKGAPPPAPDTTAEAPAHSGASPSSDAYVYTAPFETIYLAVPLTARPAAPAVAARDATDTHPAQAAIPARPATVYAWPDGAPDDGRWQPTLLPPNQAADNAGPFSEEE